MMGAAEVEQFLTHLAVAGRVAASTQNQALGALLFLYRDVLKMEIGLLDAVRARRPKRVPLVLSRGEVRQLLAVLDRQHTTEPYGLMARLAAKFRRSRLLPWDESIDAFQILLLLLLLLLLLCRCSMASSAASNDPV